jgi:hypothetical protein
MYNELKPASHLYIRNGNKYLITPVKTYPTGSHSNLTLYKILLI